MLRLAALALALSIVQTSLAAERPNVLLIMTDDQGWGDLSLHDAPGLDTPVLDSIAKDGAEFERFYVSPVCAPTRASLLTGRYHWRTGVYGVTRGREHMRSDELTIAEVFRDAGYRTGCFGKWHNGSAYPLSPTGQGFDRFFGFCAGHWNNYFDTHLRDARRLPSGRVQSSDVDSDGFIIDLIADRVIDFVRQADREPFFCYAPLNTPHTPGQMPQKYWDLFKDRADLDPKTRSAYGLVANIDDNVGRILAALDDADLAEDTIVVFLTDNGANSNRWDGNMRGTKGSVHEGGIRVPCFVRWPGQIAAGTVVDTVGMHCDLLPTLASLCGVNFEPAHPLDGVDLSAHLLSPDSAPPTPERHIITTHGPRSGTIDAAKVSILSTGSMLRASHERGKWQLWDIGNDPSQTASIEAQRPSELAKLKTAFAGYAEEFGEFEPLPIPVGLRDNPKVTLKGHETFLHGAMGTEGDDAAGEGISYDGRSGWANDFITNWTSTDAYPFWNVEVATAGTYQVDVMYRLHPADLGSSLEVVAGEESVTMAIVDAYDSAHIDSPDRIGRGETYEWEWLTRPMGRLRLDAGSQRIALRLRDLEASEGPKIIGLKLRLVK